MAAYPRYDYHTCLSMATCSSLNIDQSKAYTRAFENMGSFLSKSGHSIGKISEAFLIGLFLLTGGLDEATYILGRPNIEGLMYVDRASFDFSQVHTSSIAAHLLSIIAALDISCLSVQSMLDTLRSVYTTSIAHDQTLCAPSVLTFIEARFLLACGVTFIPHVALVSYESLPISRDKSSYESENGIRHYARAVGAGMRTSLNERFQIMRTHLQADQFYPIAQQQSPRDVASNRIKIRAIGGERIEIEHPVCMWCLHYSACVCLHYRWPTSPSCFAVDDSPQCARDGYGWCLLFERRRRLFHTFAAAFLHHQVHRVHMRHGSITKLEWISTSSQHQIDLPCDDGDIPDFDNPLHTASLFPLRNHDLLGADYIMDTFQASSLTGQALEKPPPSRKPVYQTQSSRA